MFWLVPLAAAADMVGVCVDLTHPGDASGFAETTADWGLVALGDRIDGVVVDCLDGLTWSTCATFKSTSSTTCEEVFGTCTDGSVLAARREISEWSSHEHWEDQTSSRETLTVDLLADPAAGAAWSELQLVRTESRSGTDTGSSSASSRDLSWSVDTFGAFDAELPTDGHAEFGTSAISSSGSVSSHSESGSWDDGACPWGAGFWSDMGWTWHVGAAGHNLSVGPWTHCSTAGDVYIAILDEVNLGPTVATDDWTPRFALIPAVDGDGDGYADGYDCDDANPSTHPCQDEDPGTPVDDNCDGDTAMPDTGSDTNGDSGAETGGDTAGGLESGDSNSAEASEAPKGAGCGCSAPSRSTGSVFSLSLLLGLLVRRRR